MAKTSETLGSFMLTQDRRGWFLTVHGSWWVGPFEDRDSVLQWLLAYLVRLDANVRVDFRVREERKAELEAARQALLAQVLEPDLKKTH